MGLARTCNMWTLQRKRDPEHMNRTDQEDSDLEAGARA